MLTKRFKISCSEINIRINEIKTKKAEFDGVLITDIPKALELRKEIQTLVQQTKEHIVPFVIIEGKEFPTYQLENSGKSGPELATELKNRNTKLKGSAEFMLQSPEFIKAEAGEKISTVRLQVRALFSDGNSYTYSEILTRANMLGLDFLPHETAADLLLDEKTQPKIGEWYRIVSKPITDLDGRPGVFSLEYRDDGLRLNGRWGWSESKWSAGNEFVFRVPNQ